MKEGYLLKRKTEHGVVSPQELEKINQYTRREFQAQELYTFSVVLCDNQVDRDFECFTKAALEKLKELFLGKTGIFDHSMRSGGQTARIYDCRVETLPERKNQLGEPYSRLVARAYLPRTAKNQDFITELDSGIKKEVSGEPSALLHLRRGPEEGSLPPSEGENLRRQAVLHCAGRSLRRV